MNRDRLWVISFAFALGCGTSDGAPSNAGGSGGSGGTTLTGGSTNGGSGGSSQTSGVAGARTSGGATGGLGTGGASGSPGGGGGGSGGVSMSGGSSGGPVGVGGASGGRGSGGRSSGGRGGAAPSTGGTVASAGGGSAGAPSSGGTGGCVENLACKLDPLPATDDLHQDCVDRINQFRTQCACLPPLSRRLDGEACAEQMAEYDADQDTAHAGARDQICTPGGTQNECPGYASNKQVISLCLQQMWDEGPPPTDPCEDSCFQEHGHFINMTSTTTKQVACGFFTTSAGKVWAVQNFSR